MARTTGPSAAIARISPGVQSQGLWTGRRQLFVRFAAEAETAVLYTAEMLARQMARIVGQSPLHSISLGGRDPLSCDEMIAATFGQWASPLPVMVDCDGQRPEAVERVAPHVSLVQVTVELTDVPVYADRALATLAAAAAASREHAAVLTPRDGTSDALVLRFVERAHAAAPGTKVVIHPPGAERAGLDRRYGTLLEQAMAIHADTVLLMPLPGPVGGR